jgi:hypothetical protein
MAGYFFWDQNEMGFNPVGYIRLYLSLFSPLANSKILIDSTRAPRQMMLIRLFVCFLHHPAGKRNVRLWKK